MTIDKQIDDILVAVFGDDANDPDWTGKSKVVKRLEPVVKDLIKQSILDAVTKERKRVVRRLDRWFRDETIDVELVIEELRSEIRSKL
jgi:hypothetical protein